MSTMIDGYSEGHLLKTAQTLVEKKAAATKIFDPEADERIPTFDMSELELGSVLGRGGFCQVFEVTKVSLKGSGGSGNIKKKSTDEHHIHNIVQDREFMEAHCIRRGKDYRYAIKKLRQDLVKDHQLFISGIMDLAIEARFLAVIRHPNIIKMRAFSSDTPYSRNYFVVLDRLYDTLTKRLGKWRKQGQGVVARKLLDRKGKKRLAFWLERITVAYDLSCALRHLHELDIVYRDVKPDNIGFDVRGDVKIFDFGLAKEINRSKVLEDGTYQMTGDTGSPRYMAPEVALSKTYNETADVYSFCILLHEILAMETPFTVYTTVKSFHNKVVLGGVRPKCKDKWPKAIQQTLRSGWSENMKKRPTMEELSNVLRDEIADKSDESIKEGDNDVSGKSLASLNNGS